MSDSYLATLLQIRLLVGYLGERAQFAWWPTAFYEPSSQLFLAPVFSKTSQLAQYHGVTEAARLLHDEHLNVGSYHLFRFPEEVEQDLHALVQTSIGIKIVNEFLQSKGAALESLNELTGTTFPASVGPTVVGSINSLDAGETSKKIAGAYLAAFSQNVRTYPYLVG